MNPGHKMYWVHRILYPFLLFASNRCKVAKPCISFGNLVNECFHLIYAFFLKSGFKHLSRKEKKQILDNLRNLPEWTECHEMQDGADLWLSYFTMVVLNIEIYIDIQL